MSEQVVSTKRIPSRQEVLVDDTWDLSSLFGSDQEWEEAFERWKQNYPGMSAFQGRLGASAEVLAECLSLDEQLDRQAERLGTYASLKTTEDHTNTAYQRMMGRFQNAASQAAQVASFVRPELLSLPQAVLDGYLQAPALERFRLVLERIIRFKPHTLDAAQERLLAMQSEMAQTANQTFRQLLETDLKFGFVKNERNEEVELGNSTFIQLLHSPVRAVRQQAFQQYYQQFEAHKHTFAATLAGSVQRDVYYARARGYSSSLAAALFPDQVPDSVYTNLIAAVHNHLPALHRYYELRREKMGLSEIHHFDTYVPILSDVQSRYTWSEACDTILESLTPLGADYGRVLRQGLQGRWCDRYPNVGKQSGAFSCGSYDADPFILMNYHEDVLNDVFTLAHEAGHSMHSYYSAHRQPFLYYNYTIFVAEVASTFNEQLLSRHLQAQAADPQRQAYLVNRELDDIRATVFRQTMFAEFEKLIHEAVEAGEPLTIDLLREMYGGLLELYFGPKFVLDEALSLECLRIPHFYRAFYVYKYATGMSAAIALSRRVLEGGERELGDYLRFLGGGCSQDPLDLLRDAGVDMTSPLPVRTALAHFDQLVTRLAELLKEV
jgi:oligoendopeptidase F